MAGPETVDEYINAQPVETQSRLNELRAIFRAALPDAAEVIAYGMPTYKFDSGSMYFGAAKRHVAIYGSSTVALAEELLGNRQPKGTVRFPLDQPIPAELVTKLIAATVVERTAGGER
jgi:uncharacterized protein YdhG (YjbR/CyaY superfamily)